MFPFIWLIMALMVIIRDVRNIWWVYIVTCMWINYDVRVGSITLINFLSLFIILVAMIHKNKGRNVVVSDVKKPLFNVLLYIIITNIVFLFLSTGTISAGVTAMKASILSWALFISVLFIPKGCNHKNNSMIVISLLFLSLYGIYCYVTSTNPYVDMISDYLSVDNNLQDLVESSINDSRGMLKGRITGTSMYCIQYGILLALIMVLLLVAFSEINILIFIFVGVLAFINIYLTGSRGPLLATIVAFFLFFSRSLPKGIRIKLLLLFILGYFVFYNIFSLNFASIANEDVKGSSFEQRVVQLYGAYLEVSGNIQSLLFGRGPSFVNDYLQKYGMHPLALNFESTPVYGLATYGILGLLFVFIGTLFLLWKTSYHIFRKGLITSNAYYVCTSLIVANFIYCSLVGSAYNNLFIFIYIMIIINNYKKPSEVL